jgi:hypothetical protein
VLLLLLLSFLKATRTKRSLPRRPREKSLVGKRGRIVIINYSILLSEPNPSLRNPKGCKKRQPVGWTMLAKTRATILATQGPAWGFKEISYLDPFKKIGSILEHGSVRGLVYDHRKPFFAVEIPLRGQDIGVPSLDPKRDLHIF